MPTEREGGAQWQAFFEMIYTEARRLDALAEDSL